MFPLVFGCVISASADTPLKVNESIVVEAHVDREVYVAPIQIRNESKDIEGVISGYSHFGYAATYAHNVQIKNQSGAYEPLTLNNDDLKFYNHDTIKYSWENCDYEKDAKYCSYINNHYLLETHITISNQQLVVEMFLFDSDMQIISQGKKTNTLRVNWIKQQEIRTNTNTTMGINTGYSQSNCNETSCDNTGRASGPGVYQREVNIDKPKEEVPLKWEIPHRLLDRHIQQASLLLWCSTRFKE